MDNQGKRQKRYEFAKTENWKNMQKKKREIRIKLYKMLNNTEIEEIIEFCEDELSKIEKTPYHIIFKRNLLDLVEDLSTWLIRFYRDASSAINIKTMYFEMNGFTINPKLWYISGFAYEDLYLEEKNYYWTAEWDYGEQGIDMQFIIKGFEDIQAIYKKYFNDNPEYMKYDYSQFLNEFLIILRLQELFKESYKIAKSREKNLNYIKIYITAHDYEFVYHIN